LRKTYRRIAGRRRGI